MRQPRLSPHRRFARFSFGRLRQKRKKRQIPQALRAASKKLAAGFRQNSFISRMHKLTFVHYFTNTSSRFIISLATIVMAANSAFGSLASAFDSPTLNSFAASSGFES